MNKLLLFTLLLTCAFVPSKGQKLREAYLTSFKKVPREFSDTETVVRSSASRRQAGLSYFFNDSTIVTLFLFSGPCKRAGARYSLSHRSLMTSTATTAAVHPSNPITPLKREEHQGFRGDVMYDYSSHGSPDTSYLGGGYTQHQLTANVSATINHRYPVVIHFATLQTSVPYIRSYFDASVNYDQQEYSKGVAEWLRTRMLSGVTAKMAQDSSSMPP